MVALRDTKNPGYGPGSTPSVLKKLLALLKLTGQVKLY